MITRRWWCAGTLFFTMSAATPVFGAGQDPSDIGQGRRLFAGMCVVCHGVEGAGGDAPSLNRATLDRAPDDAALRTVIADGILDRGMPRVRRLTENELRQLVGYVRSLGRISSAPPEGDPQTGSVVYQRLVCAQCHIIDGQGGSLGPILTAIGSRRPPQYLRQALIDPGAALPRGTLPIPSRGFTEYLPVLVVARDGREVRGMRINEDNFSIQLRDARNQLHSFRKSDLQRMEKETDKSLMPSYKDRLTAPELTDLVAYLSSLRGAQ